MQTLHFPLGKSHKIWNKHYICMNLHKGNMSAVFSCDFVLTEGELCQTKCCWMISKERRPDGSPMSPFVYAKPSQQREKQNTRNSMMNKEIRFLRPLLLGKSREDEGQLGGRPGTRTRVAPRPWQLPPQWGLLVLGGQECCVRASTVCGHHGNAATTNVTPVQPPISQLS